LAVTCITRMNIYDDYIFGNYTQFFLVNGAAKFPPECMGFWAEIDRALSVATSGETDLDAILPVILAAPFDDFGNLPPAVMKALAPIEASELDKIIGPYLIGSE